MLNLSAQPVISRAATIFYLEDLNSDKIVVMFMYDSWQASVHIILLAEHFIKLVLECFTDYRNKKLTKVDGVEIDTIEI